MAYGVTMWMHFHGQMSTQPSHMMHSVWSMWMNCFGLTALVQVVGVDLDERVLVGVRHHRRVGVGTGHRRQPFFTSGRPYELVSISVPAAGLSPRCCHQCQM